MSELELYVKNSKGKFERLISPNEQADRLNLTISALYSRLHRNKDLLKYRVYIHSGYYQLESTFKDADKNERSI